MANYEVSIEKLGELLNNGIQDELQRRIKEALMKNAEMIVEEVAKELAKTISVNATGYYRHDAFGLAPVVLLKIDGVEALNLNK